MSIVSRLWIRNSKSLMEDIKKDQLSEYLDNKKRCTSYLHLPFWPLYMDKQEKNTKQLCNGNKWGEFLLLLLRYLEYWILVLYSFLTKAVTLWYYSDEFLAHISYINIYSRVMWMMASFQSSYYKILLLQKD